jgi:hypothetical protein
MRIQPYYSDRAQKTQRQDENFALLAILKREKKYEEALALIDAIEAEGTDNLRKFVLYLKTNKERSIVYRKLKNKQLTEYYYILHELGMMINSIYFGRDMYMFKELYFTDAFTLSDNPNIGNKVREYVEWFKPIVYELNNVHKEIEREHNDTYLNYEYECSKDLEIYMYKKNKRFSDILHEIESNMPHHFFDKSLFL